MNDIIEQTTDKAHRRPDAIRYGMVEATMLDGSLNRPVIAVLDNVDPGLDELTPEQARALAFDLLAAAAAVEAE